MPYGDKHLGFWVIVSSGKIWINIGSGDGLLPGSPKPLRESTLIHRSQEVLVNLIGNINMCSKITLSILLPHLPGANKLVLLMLKTEYSSLLGQYHACWCRGSSSRQDISRHGIDSIGSATSKVTPLWNWSFSVEYSVLPINRGRVYRGIGYIAVACWTPFFWRPRARYF